MKKKSKSELLAGLHTLRLVTREVGHNYVAGLQADIARLESAVKACDLDSKQLTPMLRQINSLEIKPEKGRRRDLKELDRLIGKLNDLAENW